MIALETPGRPAQASARRRHVRAYIGLGANVGDAAATLASAIRALASLPGARLVAVSRLYQTRPVGVLGQPDFHNAVVSLDVPAGPDPETGAMALLIALKGLEQVLGRQSRQPWGPREVDLDLLVFGRARVRVERRNAIRPADSAHSARLLEVPHPEVRERLFVLAPLADLAPRLVPPGWDETVGRARRRRESVEGQDAVRAVAAWIRDIQTWARLGPAGGATSR